jgi:peroxin-5
MFTGGQCGADGLQQQMGQQQMSTNPLKNFMGGIVSGQHEMANQCPFPNQISQQNDINMVMGNFDQAWGNSESQVMENMQKEQMLMEAQFAQAQIQDQALMQEMLLKCPHMQQNWSQAQESQMQDQWADQLTHETNQARFAQMESTFAESEAIVDQEIAEANPQAATGDLMSQMMSDPDPKFRQSKFLQFIQNVNKGNFEINENELIKHKEEPLELLGDKEGLGINNWAEKVIGDDMDVLGEMEDAFQDSEL